MGFPFVARDLLLILAKWLIPASPLRGPEVHFRGRTVAQSLAGDMQTAVDLGIGSAPRIYAAGRRLPGVELIEDGVLGEIREAFVWCEGGGPDAKEPPKPAEPVPDYLKWDLWLGPNKDRRAVEAGGVGQAETCGQGQPSAVGVPVRRPAALGAGEK